MNVRDLAKICYIHHSAFAVETVKHVLIFDYYSPGVGGRQQLKDILHHAKGKEIVVFASHGHGDHFSDEIFEWSQSRESVSYVLSEDIKAAKSEVQVTWVGPGQSHEISELSVRTLKSTDLGVAFLVKCEGLTIYHAGDLNWWHWEGEPEEDNKAMADAYKEQIDLLKGEQVDLAFIPVDPRLEAHYLWGLEYFLDKVGAQLIFPMHFGTDYTIFTHMENDLSPNHLEGIAIISPQRTCFTYPLR